MFDERIIEMYVEDIFHVCFFSKFIVRQKIVDQII